MINIRFSFPAILSLVLAAFSPTLQADIQRIEESVTFIQEGGGYGPWHFLIDRNGFPLNKMDRMGMANLEGVSYYAIRHNSQGIMLTPANESTNSNTATQLREPSRFSGVNTFFNGVPGRGALFVSGLFARDGVLYLVACQEYSAGATIYVQGFRRKSTDDISLVPTAPTLSFDLPNSTGPVNVMPVNGSDGIYVHVITRKQNSPATQITLQVTGDNPAAQTITQRRSFELEQNIVPKQRSAADALATHEILPGGGMQEVHYLVWASGFGDGRLIIHRHFPETNTGETNGTSTFIGEDNSIFHLLEGGLKGDTIDSYPLTLVQLYENRNELLVMRSRGISVQARGSGFAGEWSSIPITLAKFNNDASRNRGAAVHSGFNKGEVLNNGGLDSTGKFASEFQQRFKSAIISFHSFEGYNWTEFSSLAILGNIFTTDTSPGSPEGLTTYNSGGGGGSPANPAAWTLLGVIHGVPPYIPYVAGGPFPSLLFKFTASQTDSNSTTIATEDNLEVSVAGSVSEGVAGGLFSIECTLTYGVKTVASKTDSTSTTTSVASSQTFEPARLAPQIDPRNVGVVCVSKPVYLSKSYAAKRWNRANFSDQKRNIAVTTVSSRVFDQFFYRLDDPEAGPIGFGASYKVLTAGMPIITNPGSLNTWKGGDSSRYTPFDPTGYAAFGVGGQGADFSSSTASTGGFEVAFLTQQGTASSTSRTKSFKDTVKASFGVKDVFGGTVTGSVGVARTFSSSQSTNFSFGRSISGSYPALPSNPLNVNKINIHAYLLNAKGGPNDRKPEWLPTAFAGSISPFLLTWEVTDVNINPLASLRSAINFDGQFNNGTDAPITATPIGNPTFIRRDKPFGGKALTLDGRNDAVRVEGDLSTTGAFTASLWVNPKPNSEASNQVVMHQADRFTLLLEPRRVGFRPVLEIGGQTLRADDIRLLPNTWSHLTVSFGKHQARLWVNGILVAERPLFTNLTASAPTIWLGSEEDGASPFRGMIDNFGFWHANLSAQNIRNNVPPAEFDRPTIAPAEGPLLRPIGGKAVFRAKIEGSGPFTYRWKLGDDYYLAEGAGISGTETDTLTLENLKATHEGAFSVVVRGPGGATTSPPFELVILQPPAIVRDPISQTVRLGDRVRLSATITGRQPATYRWFRDGELVRDGAYYSGATSPVLRIRDIGAAHAGRYQLVILNQDGEAKTEPARVNVRF